MGSMPLKRLLLLALVGMGCSSDEDPEDTGSSGEDAANVTEAGTTGGQDSASADASTATSSSSQGTTTSGPATSTSTENPETSADASTSTSSTSETTVTTPPDEETSGDDASLPFDPIALSDDFESDSLDQWQYFGENEANVRIEGGELHVEPEDSSLWFNRTTAFQMFHIVERDHFMVTASVRATRVSDPELPPETQYRLGGIMVRDPAAPNPSYVFLVFGADANDVSVEAKNTVDGSSSYEGPSWPSGSGELRICRVGAEFLMLARELGGAWQLQDTFVREDMPNHVAVGPVAYANTTPADVRISYGEITFAEIDGRDDCTS